MSLPIDSSPAFDAKSLDSLKRSAKANSPEALKAAAKQFEAVFMGMMLKSMRDATPQDGMLGNEQTKMYTSMLDQQLSQNMAKKGVGLADVLVRQLSKSYGPSGAPGVTKPSLTETSAASKIVPPAKAPSVLASVPGTVPTSSGSSVAAPSVQSSAVSNKKLEFQSKVASAAERASAETGIPAKFMIGQAALESGWGRREIKNADGATSHNIFGIKATDSWAGRTVTSTTTEYVNGLAVKKDEKFKVYESYDEAFSDYAKLLQNNPRYEKVLAGSRDAASFANGLQRAGYATDPNYATKLTQLIQKSLTL